MTQQSGQLVGIQAPLQGTWNSTPAPSSPRPVVDALDKITHNTALLADRLCALEKQLGDALTPVPATPSDPRNCSNGDPTSTSMPQCSLANRMDNINAMLLYALSMTDHIASRIEF